MCTSILVMSTSILVMITIVAVIISSGIADKHPLKTSTSVCCLESTKSIITIVNVCLTGNFNPKPCRNQPWTQSPAFRNSSAQPAGDASEVSKAI
eukprot:g41600.t1